MNMNKKYIFISNISLFLKKGYTFDEAVYLCKDFIDDKIYSKSYTIISSPSRCFNSEYKIALRDSDNVVDNYLFNSIKVGECVVVSNPFGEFYHNSIRDQKDVLAIVSGDAPYCLPLVMISFLSSTKSVLKSTSTSSLLSEI